VGFDGWLNKCKRRRTKCRNDAGFYGGHLPGENRMRSRGISGLVWAAFFIASLAATTKPSGAANCALYVRAETGVALYGAAAGWWDQAEGWYGRGHLPAVGSILVFKRTAHMRSGHVALVARVVSAREILVDHANWHRGIVSRGMSVIDTSRDQDWTQVAVIDLPSGKHGRSNPTFGFVYPGADRHEIVETRDTRSLDLYVADREAPAASSSQASLVHLAVAADDWDGSVAASTPARGRYRQAASPHRVHSVSTAATRGELAQPSAN
jgi:surface antigen